MDRIVAWYRLGSSVGAVVALIAANVIPLIGVLAFGWSVWNILVIYWLENGIVGVINILKMSTATGDEAAPGMTVMVNGRPASSMTKAGLIPFFLVHYGIFWFVHGIFVLTLPAFFSLTSDSGMTLDLGPVLFAATALVVHVAQIQDDLNHHSDLTLGYNTVSLTVNSHDVGGAITERDFELAHRVEAVAPNHGAS